MHAVLGKHTGETLPARRTAEASAGTQVGAVPSGVDVPVLSRKSSCACGGGCPACQARSSSLKISQPTDAAEIEADQIADRVMRMPIDAEKPQAGQATAPNSIHRKCSACVDEDTTIQRKPLSSSASASTDNPDHVNSVISSGGRPLDLQTRGFFEPRLGHGLGRVQVHTDERAAQAADALDAEAFSVGQDIVFGRDTYRLETAEGKRLLAHELAHVVQQTNGRVGPGLIQRQKNAPGTAPTSGVKETSYAIFFGRGDQYQVGAKLYMKTWYPDHRQLDALSLEDMFVQLAADLRARRAAGEAVWISEIALVTHAVAGGLMIPLSEEDRRRGDRDKGDLEFTPEDVVALQKRYGEQALARLRTAREEVLAAFEMGHTRIVVRGCNFGQSTAGLAALRDFFGGRVGTYAPKGYQVFQVLSLGSAEDRAALGELGINDAADAYDFLVRQRYLDDPDDAALVRAGVTVEGVPPTEKQRRDYKAQYVEHKFGNPPVIPVEAYIMASERETGAEDDEKREARRDEAEQKKQTLRRKEKRVVFRKEVDELVLEPREIEGFRPTERPSDEEYEGSEHWEGGRVWGRVSVDYGESDPAIDALSPDELISRAAPLRNPYRPQNAAMLLRLLRSYVRRPTAADDNDPLWPIPQVAKYFGDEEQIARDAALHPGPPAYDVLLAKEPLKYRMPTPEQRAQAEEETTRARAVAETVAADAASVVRARQVSERDFDARGRADMLPDGGLRLWNFAVGSADLRPQFQAPLLALAKQAAARHDVVLTVSGHTSSSGDEGLNEGLAAARAQRVFDALAAAGLPSYVITPSGHGERQPLVQERNRGRLVPRAMAQNRRVEIVLVKVSAPSSTTTPTPTPAPGPAPAGPSQPSADPIKLIDALALKKDFGPYPLFGRRRVGVLIVSGDWKLSLEGRFGLQDPTTTLKLTPDQKKAAFEVALKTELGNMRVEGEVQDGKSSKVKIGIGPTDWLDIDFAASGDLTKPFQVEFKARPFTDATLKAGPFAFRGRLSGSVILYFGPDPRLVATLAKRGGQAVLRAVVRGGAALEGLVFTELGTVTTLGAVAIGVGVGALAITMLGYFLYKIGGANIEGRVLRGASQFSWGYAHMLMQLTHEAGVNATTREKVDKYLSVDWQPLFTAKAKRWVDDEDEAALNSLYYLGEAAVAQDYNRYVRVYGDEQWKKLAASHRAKYGENYQDRENAYNELVRGQLKDGDGTFGVPMDVNP
jgi:outer membrane protein OmpA-like peptidoglycan-associated protein